MTLGTLCMVWISGEPEGSWAGHRRAVRVPREGYHLRNSCGHQAESSGQVQVCFVYNLR